jgi:NDP-sugar pyrophosphorylase family protein
MRAVVLAGGLGMRLRPYTTILPKPLLPIGDRPILEIILRQLARAGFSKVDHCVGHLGELIRVYFSESTVMPDELEIGWHWEPGEPLGTAGALRVVPELDGTFLVMNGDILTTLDYGALVAHHRESGAALTIAVQGKRVEVDLGVLELDGDRVTGYREKPTLSYDVSMGVYVYEARALEHLPDGPYQFPELVSLLLAAGEKVNAFRSDKTWFDLGTISEYERAVAELERRGGSLV